MKIGLRFVYILFPWSDIGPESKGLDPTSCRTILITCGLIMNDPYNPTIVKRCGSPACPLALTASASSDFR